MARWLAERSTLAGPARVAGRLYNLGRFPGMLPPAGPVEWVHGALLRLRDVEVTLARLDEYEIGEDSQFERLMAEAVTDENRTVRCWVYFYRGRPQEEARILGGDYLSQGRLGTPRSRSTTRS